MSIQDVLLVEKKRYMIVSKRETHNRFRYFTCIGLRYVSYTTSLLCCVSLCGTVWDEHRTSSILPSLPPDKQRLHQIFDYQKARRRDIYFIYARTGNPVHSSSCTDYHSRLYVCQLHQQFVKRRSRRGRGSHIVANYSRKRRLVHGTS